MGVTVGKRTRLIPLLCLLLFGATVLTAFPRYFTQGILPAWGLWTAEAAALLTLAFSHSRTARAVCSFAACFLPGVGMGGMMFGLDRPGAIAGLSLLTDWRTIATGAAMWLMCRAGGAMYFMPYIKGINLRRRAITSAIPFGVLLILVICLLGSGTAHSQTPEGFAPAPYAYLANIAQLWWVGMALAAAIVAMACAAMGAAVQKQFARAFPLWATGMSLTVIAIFSAIGLNGLSYLPDPILPSQSLSLANSAAPPRVLMIVALTAAAAVIVLIRRLYKHLRR